MKKSILMLMSALMFGFSACEKGGDGEIGPQGPQGEQGIAGVDGTKILSGTAVPDAGLGTIGDFYLRTSNSVLYGPKTNDGWGSGVSLKGTNGATGPKGSDGTKILSGTGTPANSLGAIGDFYFQTTTGVLYGPKTTNSWGAGISLKGPKGDTGNANVKVFEMGRKIFQGTLWIELPMNYDDATKLHMLVYAQWGNPLRQVPFRVPNFMVDYSTRPYNGKFQVGITARNPSTYEPHPNSVTLSLIRIVFIEASEVTKIASAGVDIKDFNQVKAALKF